MVYPKGLIGLKAVFPVSGGQVAVDLGGDGGRVSRGLWERSSRGERGSFDAIHGARLDWFYIVSNTHGMIEFVEIYRSLSFANKFRWESAEIAKCQASHISFAHPHSLSL